MQIFFSKKPPIRDEDIDVVKEGFDNPAIVNMFTKTNCSSDWLYWLDNNNYFDRLFDNKIKLNKYDYFFMEWLVSNFKKGQMFNLVSKHQNQVNPNNILKGNLTSVFLNSITSQTASLWIYLINRTSKKQGILAKYKKKFEEVLNTENPSIEFVFSFARETGFLFSRDRKCTKQHIINLLDDINDDIFLAAWTGLVSNGRYYKLFTSIMAE